MQRPPDPHLVDAWNREAETVFRRCRRELGCREDAEDVFALVRLRVLMSGETYRPNVGFAQWVSTITRNAIIDFRRQARHRVEVVGLSVEQIESAIQPSDPGEAEEDLIQEVSVERLIPVALEARVISPVEAQALRSAFLEEIAPSLSTDALQKCRRRALDKLLVFLFTTRMLHEILGEDRIRTAFDRAMGAMTAEEAEVFRCIVLDGNRDYRRYGSVSPLRRACLQVRKYL